MLVIRNSSILEKYTMYPTTLGNCSCIALLPAIHGSICSFWKNISGPRINLLWARFPCNHSYGYAFRRIVQTDSLIFIQNSAFLWNIRVSHQRGIGVNLNLNKSVESSRERSRCWIYNTLSVILSEIVSPIRFSAGMLLYRGCRMHKSVSSKYSRKSCRFSALGVRSRFNWFF